MIIMKPLVFLLVLLDAILYRVLNGERGRDKERGPKDKDREGHTQSERKEKEKRKGSERHHQHISRGRSTDHHHWHHRLPDRTRRIEARGGTM